MVTQQMTTPDRRGTGQRVLVAVGTVLLGVLGALLTGAGLLGVREGRGQARGRRGGARPRSGR